MELKNGDRITCEIKSLQRGRLLVSTDSMSKVMIEWGDVVRIESQQSFRVELATGAIRFGKLVRSGSPGFVRVAGADRTRDFAIADVVRIDPLEDTVVGRVDGYVKFGFGYTKASEVSQSSFGGGFVYRGRTDRIKADVSTIVTTQETRDTRNVDGALSYRRLLGKRWFTFARGGLQRRDELGIDLRSYVGAGLGRSLLHTNTLLWSVAAGAATNREEAAGGGSAGNLEGQVGTEFSIFQFDEPSADMTATLIYYVDLEGFDRSRVDFDLRLRKEIIADFFLDVSVFSNYDSRPPSASASNTDFGIVTSLGYSF